jgi:hypothetical protein
MIGKHLKDYKKKYLAERKAEPRKARIKKNSDWRKRWMPFIKYDHDFDGFFLIELINHKLHIMLDYYEHGKYCMQVDESRLEIVNELREACRLGDLIIADNFNEPAYKIMMAHMKTYTTPNNDSTCTLHMDWDTPEDEAEYDKLIKETDAVREKTIDQFFKYIRKNYRKWWD